MKAKKFLSAILCIAMVFSTMSFTAFAADSITEALDFTVMQTSSGDGWNWDADTKTLKLDGLFDVNSEGNEILTLTAGAEIALNGETLTIVNATEVTVDPDSDTISIPAGTVLKDSGGNEIIVDGNGLTLAPGAELPKPGNTLTISTKDVLLDFADRVNAGQTFEGKTVELGADIDLSGETWNGIGIYNASEVGTAFSGTFDGNGYKIENVTFAAKEYTGFFNQLYKATVEDLTVEVNGFVEGAEGSYGGAAIAGHAISSTIDNCVAEGKIEGTHNVAGIVVRAEGSTIKNCTNKANLTNSYSKLGGIVNLTQYNAIDTANKATVIDSCINEGTITSAARGENGVGGIIGWIGYGEDSNNGKICVTIQNCENKGSVTGTDAAVLGQMVGCPNSYWNIPEGNKGRTDILAIGTENTGAFNYATVENNVATYANTLEAGETYLVTAKGAKPVINLGYGETVSFDTTLAALADASGITADSKLESETNGNIVTYTAASAAAKIGDTPYATIQGAINAANEGDEITLLSDCEESGITVAADDDVIIDLNGKTVTGDFMVYGKATIKNGTINNTNKNVSGIESNGASADLTTEDLIIISDRHALRVDGGKAHIISGTYTSTANGSSCYAVNAGGDIATELVIDGGTFIASSNAATQGTSVMLKNGLVTTTINGGTFNTADVHCVENYGKMTITGGEFTGSIVQNETTSISGGTYTVAPKLESVVEGKYPVKNGDVYIIGDPVVEMNGTYYADFDEAWGTAVNAGGAKTIKLLANANHSSEDYSSNMKTADLTIDLNGFNLTLDKDMTIAGSMYGGNKLTINDTTNASSVIFNNNSCIRFGNDYADTLVINGGKFVKADGNNAIIRDEALGKVNQTITINGGDFTGVAGDILGGKINENDTVTKADSVSVKAPIGYKWENNTTLVEYTATGDLQAVYTSDNNGVVTIWGEMIADPIDDLYVEILAEDGTVMGSVKLNDIDGIYGAETSVLTWHMMVAGDEYDTYWTTTWNEGYPNVENQPANAALYVDGVKVDTRPVQMNSADNLNTVQWKNFFPCATVNGTQYNSIQAAIDAAGDGDTITLISDRITDGAVNISSEKNVVIDLNGKTVTGYFWVNGKAEFMNGTIDASALNKSAIEINSSETIDGTKGTFAPVLVLTDVDAISNRHGLRIDGGKATINGGTYEAIYQEGTSGYAVNASSGAIVTIEYGTFKANKEGVSEGTFVIGSRNTGTKVTINGGNFSQSTGTTLATSDSGEIVVNAGTYEKDPSAYLAEGLEATFANGVYTVNNERKFIVKAIDNDDVKDKTVVAGETVTVKVYLEGTELYGATWELVYDSALFSTEDTLSGSKFTTKPIASDEPLATYTFTALPQDTEVEYTFTLKDAVAQTNDESIENIEPTPIVVTNEAKVTIALDAFETEAAVDGTVVSTETNTAEVDYTAEAHTVTITSVPDTATIDVTVDGNVQTLDENGSFTLTEGGTYTIKYVVTQKGYETFERTFTLEIADPDYVVELAKDYAAFEGNAKNMVLVYTNSKVIGFEYDGTTMFDVTYKGYMYNGTDTYERVYAIVVDNIEGGELAAYEANVDCICEKTADKFVIKAPNPTHDLTGDGKITISDATTAFGVYRVYSNYYSKYMATVLTADVNSDKQVNGSDTTGYTTAFYAEKNK